MRNIYGGGAQTNVNGLAFERETSLEDALRKNNYSVQGGEVYRNNKLIGYTVSQNALYKEFLSPRGVDYQNYNSKKYLPDECFVNELNKTAYIIEKKFQAREGSVDEKITTCDFKKKVYARLFKPIHYKVEYIFVFDSWFKKDKYKDALEYIESVGCYYYFDVLPLEAIALEAIGL